MIDEKFFSNCDELIALLREEIDLMGKLKQALRLVELLGLTVAEAKIRKISSKLRDNGRHGYYGARPWEEFDYIGFVDGEEVLRKPLKEVHLDLWPDDLRQKYEQFLKRKAANAARRDSALLAT